MKTKQNLPASPFTTRLSGSEKETELRIRSIVQWKKKRPPVIVLVVAVLVIAFCGSLIGFGSTPRNGTLAEVYQEFFAENPTNQIGYVNKDAMGYPMLTPEDEAFHAAMEYMSSMNLRSVIGGKKYIGDFDHRQGSISLRSATGQGLEIDLYPTVGYVVISEGSDAMVPSGKDARVYQWDESFDAEVFLSYLASKLREDEPQTAPQVTPAQPESSPTGGTESETLPSDDVNDPSLVLSAMEHVKSTDFTNPEYFGIVTAEQLAAALNAAVEHQISEAEFMTALGGSYAQFFPHWYIEDAWLEGGTGGHPGTDRNLDIRCGLPENIVEVTLSEDNQRNTAYFEDARLYWLIREKDAFEDRMTSLDPVAYEQFKPLLIDQMERTLAAMSNNPGNFTGYELKRFTIAWTYDNEQDGSHVKLYHFSFGLLTDTPETVGWAGGMALDSHLRVVNVGEPKYFAVKYRNGQVVSTAFLAPDYELGRSDQDKEHINRTLDAAEQTRPGISIHTLSVPDAYRAVLHGQAEYYDPESNQFFNLAQVQAYGYTGDGPAFDLSNFTVMDLDRDGISEVVVVANWDTAMASHSIILHYHNGTVYGYTRYIRQFNYLTLRADGTYAWAGSAFNHGYGTLSFGPEELATNQFTYIDANVSPTVYIVDNAPATEADFTAAITKQENKPDAAWYAFTAENINTLLAE